MLLASLAQHRARQPCRAAYRDFAARLVSPLAGGPPGFSPWLRGVRPRQHRPVRSCLQSRLAAIAATPAGTVETARDGAAKNNV